ncbi:MULTISPECIES: hemerythrin domain-containing protein [unclassified Streptomyces]|uniref:hemerythrin domain-containing protein n=1 Tax=unclassified Streptomyces TaxID=2593676 RepID=UPI00035CFA96|nr:MULTISPECIES: hemerythrin domain-containing protein [unclassified Streptomyces]MYT29656.1 hemerythrin domain-containing protein [Streptomyces sp. SID8354]
MASHGGDRVVALSRQLAQAHQELLHQVEEIRNGLGHRRLSDGTLLAHCLAFCSSLTAHHKGEDDGIFSQLLQERPDLTTTVAKLVEDHEMISSILSRVSELAERAAGLHGPALESIGRELDGLAAIMESHFRYEERAISKALDDRAPDTDWPSMVFGFGVT